MAKWVDRYGGSAFINAAYPTDDKSCPWWVFWKLYGALDSVLAFESVRRTLSHATARGLTNGSPQSQQVFDGMLSRAFPGE